MPTSHCLCPALGSFELATKIVLLMHCREWRKPSATGPMALAALPNHELLLHGLPESPLDFTSFLDDERDSFVLFPSSGAISLSKAVEESKGRPATLIVPDGNWGQGRRIARRLVGLPGVIPVTLPEGPETEWGLRRETRPSGLSTYEAIARAVGILESRHVQRKMEEYFRLMVKTTWQVRGAPVPDPSAGSYRETI